MILRNGKNLFIDTDQKRKKKLFIDDEEKKRKKIDLDQKKTKSGEFIVVNESKKIDLDQKKTKNGELIVANESKKINLDQKKTKSGKLTVVDERKKIDLDQKKRKNKKSVFVSKRKKIDTEVVNESKKISLDQKKRKNKKSVFVNKRKKIDGEKEPQGKVVIIERKRIDERAAAVAEVEKRHLPEELFTENILTRLPFRDLAASCSGVSKSWYNLIYNDERFAATHLVQQNQKNYNLFLHLLYDPTADKQERSYVFRLAKDRYNNYLKLELSLVKLFLFKYEFVGYCNGLTCYNERGLDDGTGTISVVNVTTLETLSLSYNTPGTWKYNHLCHGFGLDPLSQEYKVVLIYTSEANDKFRCIVITLGTSPPWRKTTISTAEVLSPPGSSPFPSRVVTRVSAKNCGSASGTLCAGGDLFWRMTNEVLEDNINEHDESRRDNKVEMLLSFNLHDEKLQFIQLPPQSTMNEHPCFVLDPLLEYKGYPCVARSEKMMSTNNDQHWCKDESSCSCCKVHLYILKDKVKQVWILEKTFDVRIRDQGALTSLSCYLGAISATCPPARISTVSDQVLLYWFNGESLVFYNLQTRQLEEVKGSPNRHDIFRTEMNEFAAIGSDDSTRRPYMDCRLQAQVENLVSMKTFIPDGETFSSKCLVKFINFATDRSFAGWVTSGRASPEYHGFF